MGLDHYTFSCPDGTVIDLDKDPGKQCAGGTGGSGGTGSTSTSATTTSTTSGNLTSSSSGIACANAWESDCSGVCVNTLNAPANCQVCGHTCNTAAGDICEAGGSNIAQCANVDWSGWPMPNIGADVSLHAAPHLMGYIDNGDGTVTDTVTHLIWQQVVDPTKTYSVDDARNYCAVTLSKSGLGCYHDWRLPSLIELISLIDYGHPAPGPMINGTFFPGTPSGTSDPFWSTTRFSAASGWQPCDGRRPSKAMTHRSSQRSEIVAWSTRSSSLEAGVDHDAAHVSLEK